jgi:hypothetical protein
MGFVVDEVAQGRNLFEYLCLFYQFLSHQLLHIYEHPSIRRHVLLILTTSLCE